MMQRQPGGEIGPFRGFTFKQDAWTGAVEFDHGLVVHCTTCDQHLSPEDPVAREAVMFFLSHNGAAKLARVVGRGLGLTGTRREQIDG